MKTYKTLGLIYLAVSVVSCGSDTSTNANPFFTSAEGNVQAAEKAREDAEEAERIAAEKEAEKAAKQAEKDAAGTTDTTASSSGSTGSDSGSGSTSNSGSGGTTTTYTLTDVWSALDTAGAWSAASNTTGTFSTSMPITNAIVTKLATSNKKIYAQETQTGRGIFLFESAGTWTGIFSSVPTVGQKISFTPTGWTKFNADVELTSFSSASVSSDAAVSVSSLAADVANVDFGTAATARLYVYKVVTVTAKVASIVSTSTLYLKTPGHTAGTKLAYFKSGGIAGVAVNDCISFTGVLFPFLVSGNEIYEVHDANTAITAATEVDCTAAGLGSL